MEIAIDQIVPDPEQPRKQFEDKRLEELQKSVRSLGMIHPLVVRQHPAAPEKYMIVVGERRWRAAAAAGHGGVDCTVRNDLTEQEARELQLTENYHHEAVPPMEMGRAFLSYREKYGISQQELARRTGITPGTIHHYESLVRNLAPDLGKKVESGALTFKEARSIADINDFERQREVAAPFVSGRLSSVYVEKVVGRAKKSPDSPIERVLEEVLKGTRAEATVKAEAERVPRTGVDLSKLESGILQLAGQLDALQLQVIPEYRRLKLISTLRILESKVESAVIALSRSEAREIAVPRPLIRTPIPHRR